MKRLSILYRSMITVFSSVQGMSFRSCPYSLQPLGILHHANGSDHCAII